MAVAVPLPGADSRWRCAGCGNLTRFDVSRTTRVREYWHQDLAGHAAIESTEVVSVVVERVSCRWCGSAAEVTLVPRPA
jgi:hypothetical protein